MPARRPGNTVPGSLVRRVGARTRRLTAVTRDGRRHRLGSAPTFVFTARRRGNYVKAYALPRTRKKKFKPERFKKIDGGTGSCVKKPSAARMGFDRWPQTADETAANFDSPLVREREARPLDGTIVK